MYIYIFFSSKAFYPLIQAFNLITQTLENSNFLFPNPSELKQLIYCHEYNVRFRMTVIITLQGSQVINKISDLNPAIKVLKTVYVQM